jgi:NADPH:quinone reductase-like Zn-dependent oxidoreductase
MGAVAFPQAGVPLIACGAVTLHITETYPWEQDSEAHRRLENRETQGKLALVHSAYRIATLCR